MNVFYSKGTGSPYKKASFQTRLWFHVKEEYLSRLLLIGVLFFQNI